jgi:hypothetical protein
LAFHRDAPAGGDPVVECLLKVETQFGVLVQGLVLTPEPLIARVVVLLDEAVDGQLRAIDGHIELGLRPVGAEHARCHQGGRS